MTPYYEDRSVTIYSAPWEVVWAELALAPEQVALCWADPPYGVKEKTSRARAGRGRNPLLPNQGKRLWSARDWDPVVGDDQPVDPRPLLIFPRLVCWGANHYAHRLPASSSWWWWDKRDGTTPDDNADGELAWTNLGGPARQFTHLWRGLCQASEKEHGGRRLHPTQKPVALSTWGFQRAKLEPGALVFSPYMGSGPELRSALDLGLRIIACEVDPNYCAAVVRHRVAQQSLALK